MEAFYLGRDNMSFDYDAYKKNIAEGAKRIKVPKEITQDTLHFKNAIIKAVEDEKIEGVYSGKMEFGYTERFVNYIIQIAYEKGRADSAVEYKKVKAEIKEELMSYLDEI
jgi:hypothetical protein